MVEVDSVDQDAILLVHIVLVLVHVHTQNANERLFLDLVAH